ncbi:hypothetical protein ANO11243_020230 [Dothideomycetidae sp. 11243]|nr:hypothetical protein ANO11243_020230 [fungal sp. No.11243]
MKFGKDFERELVPEWRAKYLDYRQGKKKLKAVARALRNAGKPSSSFRAMSPLERRMPVSNLLNQRRQSRLSNEVQVDRESRDGNTTQTKSPGTSTGSSVVPINSSSANEQSPLAMDAMMNRAGGRTGMTRYGSIIGTPPDENEHMERIMSNIAPSLRLPGPAMDTQDSTGSPAAMDRSTTQASGRPPSIASLPPGVSLVNPRQRAAPDDAEHRLSRVFTPNRVNSSPVVPANTPRRPFLQRVLSLRPNRTVTFASPDAVPMEAYKDVEARQDEFFDFLDSELRKIDEFYKDKEEKATERLVVLREQLHIMRDRRMEEVLKAESGEAPLHIPHHLHFHESNGNGKAKEQKPENGAAVDVPWLNSLDKAFDKAKLGHVGKTFSAMKDLGTPSGPSAVDLYKDYTRKPFSHEVPYRTAKHKLKVALAEYYRGLELLKSYALLNRTAFRKIVKKYDKTVQAQPTGKYMTEKVNKAYFVNSEVIEGHIHAVEDLYSRYFERGNRKVAVGKLRAKIVRAGEFSQASFINGILLSLGTAFGVEGLVYASNLLESPDKALTLQTTYLLQLYGGFFLTILLALFFCLACRVWHRSKVNYTFCFEFDTRRQVLDWRQLTEIPSVLYFLLGVTIWLNFRQIGGPGLFLWWPVIITGLVLVVLLNPLPILYPKSRQWFAYSLWRLLFAGIYPVEFRDFFMGDLFCSETYAMANIELFFCTYAQHPMWSHPTSCSSLHSRLLGFFTCLPGIWRALQCIRRYKDTKNVFPHLVNCGKYICTIMQYLTLSLYRMNFSTSTKAAFVLFGVVNGTYTSVWDLAMDWSLLDPYAKNRFLRKTLAFKSTWPYYAAMVIDPIIRFNFVLYIFYTESPKYAALVSFFVSFTEVCRRGMWMIFRVENEHCSNVGRFRAYRDAPLPYDTAPPTPKRETSPPSGTMSGREYREHASRVARDTTELRRRRGQSASDSPISRALVRAGTMIHFAHTQDFERKRKPESSDAHGEEAGRGRGAGGGHDDDEEDYDSEDNSDMDLEEAELARARGSHSMSPSKKKGV